MRLCTLSSRLCQESSLARPDAGGAAQRLPGDLIECGHTIQVPLVQVLHEGMRRARAAGPRGPRCGATVSAAQVVGTGGRQVEDLLSEPTGFREFVAARQRALLRSAWLLTGDWHAAEDLVQSALAKTWPRWHSIARQDQPELYVRRVIVNTHATWWRRKWRNELPTGDLPETAGTDEFSTADTRAALRAALAALPPRQRATVVLRYFDDLTEEQTAAVLGCSIGAVKSQTSRALAKLRTFPLFDDKEAVL